MYVYHGVLACCSSIPWFDVLSLWRCLSLRITVIIMYFNLVRFDACECGGGGATCELVFKILPQGLRKVTYLDQSFLCDTKKKTPKRDPLWRVGVYVICAWKRGLYPCCFLSVYFSSRNEKKKSGFQDRTGGFKGLRLGVVYMKFPAPLSSRKPII